MLKLSLGNAGTRPKKILCLGAHSDDIEIGCGGTLLRLLEDDPDLEVLWVVFSANAERKREALKSARLFLANAKSKEIVIKSFRDGFFPSQLTQIKMFFERLQKDNSPDVIFTHFRKDLHQDHRVISNLTWNTFRRHLILEFEIPKYDGDLGVPNTFVELSEPVCRQKIGNLLTAFPSQRKKSWFTEETFRSILRLRGIESGTSQTYAEGFYCRKALL